MGFLLFLLVMAPASVPLWINRPGKYIRLLGTDEDSVEFAVQSKRYAQEFATLNGASVTGLYD